LTSSFRRSPPLGPKEGLYVGAVCKVGSVGPDGPYPVGLVLAVVGVGAVVVVAVVPVVEEAGGLTLMVNDGPVDVPGVGVADADEAELPAGRLFANTAAACGPTAPFRNNAELVSVFWYP